MTDAIMMSKAIRTTNIDQIVETKDSIVGTEVCLDKNKIIGEVISKIT